MRDKIISTMEICDLLHYEITGEYAVITMVMNVNTGRASIESNASIDPLGLLMILMANKHFNRPGKYLGQTLLRTDSEEKDGTKVTYFHHLYDDKKMIIGECRTKIINYHTYYIDNVTINDVKKMVMSLYPDAHDLVNMHPKKIRRILTKKSGCHYVKFEIL
jgi:hypothetical protein